MYRYLKKKCKFILLIFFHKKLRKFPKYSTNLENILKLNERNF